MGDSKVHSPTFSTTTPPRVKMMRRLASSVILAQRRAFSEGKLYNSVPELFNRVIEPMNALSSGVITLNGDLTKALTLEKVMVAAREWKMRFLFITFINV